MHIQYQQTHQGFTWVFFLLLLTDWNILVPAPIPSNTVSNLTFISLSFRSLK